MIHSERNLEIRRLYDSGLNGSQLAKRFSLSNQRIYQILGKTGGLRAPYHKSPSKYCSVCFEPYAIGKYKEHRIEKGHKFVSPDSEKVSDETLVLLGNAGIGSAGIARYFGYEGPTQVRRRLRKLGVSYKNSRVLGLAPKDRARASKEMIEGVLKEAYKEYE